MNESNLQYINGLGRRGGLNHDVHPNAKPLSKETGEVFSQYHKQQKLWNKTYEQSKIGQCLCPVCPVGDDLISDDDNEDGGGGGGGGGDIEQFIDVDIDEDEPKSVASTPATASIPTTATASIPTVATASIPTAATASTASLHTTPIASVSTTLTASSATTIPIPIAPFASATTASIPIAPFTSAAVLIPMPIAPRNYGLPPQPQPPPKKNSSIGISYSNS